MLDIDSRTDEWAKTYYKDINLDQISIKSSYKELVWETFSEMGILNKYMTGDSVESLPRNNNSENLNGPKFSDAFHFLKNQMVVSPGIYLAFILNEYLERGLDKKLLTGYLSRALRSFASFMREPDLAYKLKSCLEEECDTVTINMDPKQDIKGHVDILITYKGKKFNIWSYQATRRGLPNTIDRLSGNRGEVCDGINILCPLKTEDAQSLVKKKQSILKKNIQLKNWEIELDSKPSLSREKTIRELLEKNNFKLIEMKKELRSLYEVLSEEVIIKNNWFLHAESYVNSVKIIMDNYLFEESKYIQYDELKRIIEGPEIFVKNINIFTK
jgi:hypothetical protein